MNNRPESRHRADVRPRYGRIAVLCLSVATTGVALLGGLGVLSASPSRSDAQEVSATTAAPAPATSGPSSGASTDQPSDATSSVAPDARAEATDVALPADSGTGRRVVFDQSDQRVWLVKNAADRVTRSYLVSGSLTKNLDPGTYSVYSRSMNAIGIDDSGTMTHFVRFTQGPSGAAIGFHDIPKLDGKRVQTQAELGTPRSHGCIRQSEGDAIAMWAFAQSGTKVVVTA